MDSLDWEFRQLCRRMERTEARRKAQQSRASSSETYLQTNARTPENGYIANKVVLKRIGSIPLEHLNGQELEKAVNRILAMALLDIVGTEGARGLLKIRRYCADDLILQRLLEAFEQMFHRHKSNDPGEEKR